MQKDNRRGLTEVRVLKTELVDRMEDNLETHRSEHNETIAGWRRKIDTLADSLCGALADENWERVDKIRTKLRNATKPNSHAEDYEHMLVMLGASQDEEFVLSNNEFNQYWLDEWRWTHEFKASTSLYSEG